MSNFKCEICDTPILASPRGYMSECKHYPIEILKKSNYFYYIAEEPVTGFIIGRAKKGKGKSNSKVNKSKKKGVDMATESSIEIAAAGLKTFKVTGKLNKDCVFNKIVTGMNKADAWQQTKRDLNKISQPLHISIEEV